ncbi:MAG TPA: hypothetical protein VIX12_10015 [Candidatus Binataceae bacterium]
MQRLAQLIEQPRILDADDGLGGKRFEKRNLPIRKWINLGTRDRSYRYSLA